VLVLLVEDNSDIAGNVSEYLAAHGHQADFAATGRQALYLLESQDYDAVVLDLGLPDMDGLELCRLARCGHRNPGVPILMLTARDTLPQRLAGFEAGADDYLVKPFAAAELLARLVALGRRAQGSPESELLRVGDLAYNTGTLELTRGGQPLQLPPVPRQILEHLMRNQHRVVSRQELERLLWGDEPPDSDALRSHIHKLRSVIDKPFPQPLLQTVPRLGFRLHAPA
jgi:DNA-binding response OmpR family regulator